MGELRSDFIGRTCQDSFPLLLYSAYLAYILPDPVGSVIPTQDSQTYLVATVDNHIRLMDSSTGKILNDFTGHLNESYRTRACFGHAEASVICGDENGQVWAWDLLDVCPYSFCHPPIPYKCHSSGKAYATQSTAEGPSKNNYMDRASSKRCRWDVNS